MKIELSENQVKQLINIIANCQIRGNEASALLDLARAIQTPAKEEVKKEDD